MPRYWTFRKRFIGLLAVNEKYSHLANHDHVHRTRKENHDFHDEYINFIGLDMFLIIVLTLSSRLFLSQVRTTSD